MGPHRHDRARVRLYWKRMLRISQGSAASVPSAHTSPQNSPLHSTCGEQAGRGSCEAALPYAKEAEADAAHRPATAARRSSIANLD